MPLKLLFNPHYKQVHGDADAMVLVKLLLEDQWWKGWEKKTSYILPCWFRAEEWHNRARYQQWTTGMTQYTSPVALWSVPGRELCWLQFLLLLNHWRWQAIEVAMSSSLPRGLWEKLTVSVSFVNKIYALCNGIRRKENNWCFLWIKQGPSLSRAVVALLP